MRWVVALLVLFAAWTAFILYFLVRGTDGGVFGSFLLVISIALSLTCKVTAREIFARAPRIEELDSETSLMHAHDCCQVQGRTLTV